MSEKGQWQIILAEQNMNLGWVDNLFFGKDACHSFLALRNPEGAIVSELHGTTFLPSAARISTGGQSWPSYLRAGAEALNLSSIFERAVKAIGADHNFPQLKVVTTPGPWRMDRAEESRVVLSGDKEQILTEWIDACRIGEELNKLDLFYVPVCPRSSGQNCNSVTALLLHAMDVDVPKLSFNLAAVGYNNKLHEKLEPLRAFDTAGDYDPADLDGLLAQHTRSADNIFFTNGPGAAMLSRAVKSHVATAEM